MIFTTHPERPAYDFAVPAISIGDKIKPFKIEGYHRRRIVRALIVSKLQTLHRLRRMGHIARMPGDTAVLTKKAKDGIRAVLNVIDTAYEVEVIGLFALAGPFDNQVANQSYVSYLEYYCQLVWRAQIDKNHVATMQPIESVGFCFDVKTMQQQHLLAA